MAKPLRPTRRRIGPPARRLNMKGNPKPEGNISYFDTIEEKEEMCKKMVGYNESLIEKNKGDK